MPRKPGIWKRSGTEWYYTTQGKNKIRLSKDRKEALQMFYELMAKQEEAEKPSVGLTFGKLADEFMKNTQHLKSEEVFTQQMVVIEDFSRFLNKKKAADLRGHMVLAWLKTHTTWGVSTQSLAKKVIKAVCNWGVNQGYLEEHPLKKLSSGTTKRRDRVITPEEWVMIREFVSPAFADFLFVVHQTGGRPYSEVGQVEARHVDFANSTATLADHKNAKKTGKPRVLYFTEESMAIIRRLAEEYPAGPLFRTARHSRWSAVSAWKWFHDIEVKLGIKAHTYALRHTRITEALINGVPVEVVAELVGNTPQVIHKHYAHVAKNHAAMVAAAKKAAGPTT